MEVQACPHEASGFGPLKFRTTPCFTPSGTNKVTGSSLKSLGLSNPGLSVTLSERPGLDHISQTGFALRLERLARLDSIILALGVLDKARQIKGHAKFN
jgi:hypothetical protein